MNNNKNTYNTYIIWFVLNDSLDWLMDYGLISGIRPSCNRWGIEVLLGVRHSRSGNLHVHALGPVHKWIVSLVET